MAAVSRTSRGRAATLRARYADRGSGARVHQLSVWPAEEWAAAVAGELAARLRRQPRLRLCLPTGDTPSPVYRRLVAASARGEAPFGQASVLLLDEYLGLRPGDRARCDARLRRELLELLDPGPAAFHPILVDELDPAAAAQAHESVAAEGLDLALVGLGGNGHVGLNEPGSGAESVTRVVELAPESRAAATARYGAATPPSQGISLGLASLLAADELWLLVTGAPKADVLARALDGPERPDCPASFLRRHARLTVWADEAAASALGGRSARRRQTV